MHFLECPLCGCPLDEDKDKPDFMYCCSGCRRIYLYDEGTLVDLGEAGPAPAQAG